MRGGIFAVKKFPQICPPPFTVNMPPSLNQLSAASDKARGGIFAVKMLTFSGKSDEEVMGVNGFDCIIA